MSSDASNVDAALIAVLNNDAALRALVPDGWYYDVAPPNSRRFGIVSRIPGGLDSDVPVFGARAVEDYLYLIKVVMLSTAGGDIKAAAARVGELLEDVPLVVDGYEWSTTYRLEFVRMTELDDADPSIRWLHRGGRYRVQMALAPSALTS